MHVSIYLLGQNATSCAMLNGGVTQQITLISLIRPGCPLTLLENMSFIDQNNWSKSKTIEIIDQKSIGQNYKP